MISNLMTDYNPAKVMLGSGGSGPYINSSSSPTHTPIQQASGFATQPNPIQQASTNIGGTAQVPIQQNTLAPESVRATGSGPFDDAYRQNLATYAGGQFQRPGGNLSFNPTSTSLFGNPTGGGNDPVLGMGNSLLSLGLGGQPAAFANPNQ